MHRGAKAVHSALRPAFTTTRFLIAIMVPVSLAVSILDHSGLLQYLAKYLDPAMHLIGLTGASSLVFISALLLNIYSAIAVIATLELSPRQITILAVMCLLAHNLIVECAVMKRTGSSVTKMILLRVGTAIFAAWFLNLILPQDMKMVTSFLTHEIVPLPAPIGLSLPSILLSWLVDSSLLVLKVAAIVTALMILQKLMEEFGLLDLLGKVMSPIMVLLGLPASTGFLWIVANLVGLAYGSAILIERADSGKIPLADSDLFNHHVAISHSLLEDTLLFMAIGVGFFWLVIPRLLIAIPIVWIEKGRRFLFRRSFRVGTIQG